MFILWLVEMMLFVIFVKNVFFEYFGIYSCIVRNRVGFDQCLLCLNVVFFLNKVGLIVGVIIGILFVLVFIGVIIFCCYKKCREEKYEKEVYYDIREDVLFLKSCMFIVRSYIGSNYLFLGFMFFFNMEGYFKIQYN